MEMLMIFMVIKKYIISFADGNFLQIVGCFLKFSFMGNKTGLRSQFNILLTPTPAWKCLPTPQIFFPTQDSRLLKKKISDFLTPQNMPGLPTPQHSPDYCWLCSPTLLFTTCS